jgi:hypothetical protein
MGMKDGELIWESHFSMDINVQGSLREVIETMPNFLNSNPTDELVEKFGPDEAQFQMWLERGDVHRPKEKATTTDGNTVKTNSLGNIKVKNGPITSAPLK